MEKKHFLLKKSISEWGLLLRNTIIISICIPLSFLFSQIAGYIFITISIIFIFFLIDNVRKEYFKIKKLYYENGQKKWVKNQLSRINHIGHYKVTEFYENGNIKYEYQYSGSLPLNENKLTINKSLDENGKEINFDFENSSYYRWWNRC